MLFVFAGFFIWFIGDFPSAGASARTPTGQYFYQAEKVNDMVVLTHAPKIICVFLEYTSNFINSKYFLSSVADIKKIKEKSLF